MTDTEESIVKPLVWERGDCGHLYAESCGYHYQINTLENGTFHCYCLFECFASEDEAIKFTQDQHEARILPALDLTAHDAAVRAKTLKEVEAIASRLWYSTLKCAIRSIGHRGPWSEIEQRQKTFLDDIRALAEQGGK